MLSPVPLWIASLMRPLDIRTISVGAQALDIEIAVPLDYLHVGKQTARRILALLPNLANHICMNGNGERFGDEIEGTELPHLFEHVVIELQAQALGRMPPSFSKPAPSLIGHTSWAAELRQTRAGGYALMRTSVRFANDFVALKACVYARQLVEWSCSGDADAAAPDIERMVAELAALFQSA